MIRSRRLLIDPGSIDPLLRNETYRGFDLRASAITKTLERVGTDLKLFVRVHINIVTYSSRNDPAVPTFTVRPSGAILTLGAAGAESGGR